MAKKTGSPWLLFLFALPFAGVGIGMLLFSVLPSLYEWQSMKSWQPVAAQLTHAELKTSRGDDSDTYQALARYQYRMNGVQYQGDRVGIMSGSDNIGRWQQDRARELQRQLNQTITVYVNPDDYSESVIYPDLRWGMLGFKLVFVVVFGGVGIGLMIATLVGRKKTQARQARKEAGQALWLQEPDWANPVSSGGRSGFYGLLFFAVIWNAISMPLLFVIPDEVRSGNTPALIGLLFPLVGAGLIVAAVVQFSRWRRFGSAQLTLDPWPGAIGGHVGGSFVVSLPQHERPDILVTLACLRSYYTGSGKDRKRTEKVIWQKEGIAAQTPVQHATRVSFHFAVPDNLPASELADSDYHFWRVSFSAPLKGADLALDFEIPVFATGATAQTAGVESDQHPALVARHEQQLDQLLNARQLPDGVALYFDYFRNPLGKLIGIVFGAVFAGAGLFMWNSDAPAFMAFIFSLIGGGIVVGCLYALLNSYTVKMGSRGIYTERRILGVLVRKRLVQPDQVRYLTLKKNGSSQTGAKTTEHFVIDALLKDGGKIRVAESLNGRGLAEQALESLALLSGFAKQ